MTNKFDIDLSWGQMFEKKLEDILRNKKIEVKMSGSLERYCNNCNCKCHCYSPECDCKCTDCDCKDDNI